METIIASMTVFVAKHQINMKLSVACGKYCFT